MKSIFKKLWVYTQKREHLRKIASILFNKIGGNKKSIKGIGNKINYEEAFLKGCSIIVKGNNNLINIKKGAVLINTNILIVGDNHLIEIGENCIIKKSGFCFEDSGCKIIIGKNTTAEGIQVAALELNTSINIGEDCMFSAGISIRNSDSHTIIDKMTNKRINYAKNIVIDNHTWVGEDVRILKGAEIGSNCIIGVGAIVTNKIPSNCVAAGVPAKVVKENVSWLRQRIYSE
ncbi:acyltransferase [Neobacillus sp. M.A.Huq-85]